MSASVELLFFSLLFVLAVFKILAVGAKQFVPPDERWRIIAEEVVMVEVMKPSTGITRYEMKRVEEWYVIATVHINRFHQPDCDPCPQQYEMSCGRDDAEKESKPKYCKYMQQCCYFNCVCIADYTRRNWLSRLQCSIISSVCPYRCSNNQKVVDEVYEILLQQTNLLGYARHNQSRGFWNKIPKLILSGCKHNIHWQQKSHYGGWPGSFTNTREMNYQMMSPMLQEPLPTSD